MPYQCVNITDLSRACSDLTKYCNNHYAIELDWCNCFNNNYSDKCDFNYIGLIIIMCTVGWIPILFIIICIYHYGIKDRFTANTTSKVNKNSRNSETPINHYPAQLIPLSTNIRSNAITNLQPMMINDNNNNDNNNEIPEYENPPKYTSACDNEIIKSEIIV